MKRNIHIKTILFCIIVIINSIPSYGLTPDEVLKKCKDNITTASGISADFSMTGAASATGTVFSKGKKFAVITSGTCTWYNGKDMWTYNSSTKETTISTPGSSELAQSNPLAYINSTSDYNVTASKTQEKGVETIVLIPKKKGSSIKSITLKVNSKTYLPKSLKISISGGKNINVNISNINTKALFNDNTFTYPSSKYNNAKIIDLR